MNERLNDFTWYSRLAVWVGAAVLLVESVSGHSLAVLTVLAVLALAAGLLGFLGGLIGAEGRLGRLVAAVTASEEALITVDSGEAARDRAQEVAPRDRTPVVEAVPVAAAPVVQQSSRGAHSVEVTASAPLLDVDCARCGRGLGVGEVAGICVVCGSVHHVTCWVDNHFHCAAPGCGNHGGLLAPEAAQTNELTQ